MIGVEEDDNLTVSSEKRDFVNGKEKRDDCEKLAGVILIFRMSHYDIIKDSRFPVFFKT